jgi:hypothetical protein
MILLKWKCTLTTSSNVFPTAIQTYKPNLSRMHFCSFCSYNYVTTYSYCVLSFFHTSCAVTGKTAESGIQDGAQRTRHR